ncbi:MAG: DinB family protein [Armatimonadota bacterium]|nr:DinB family protein [Armatimonadota bacterium]
MLEYFKSQAEIAYGDLLESIRDLDELGSWSRLTPREGDYLHSDGSIIGQVTHVAGCKVLYGSAAFHSMETRLKEITERTIAIGTDWEEAKAYLEECQAYWLSSWSGLHDDALDDLAPTNWGDEWPIWKILNCVMGHDHYHAGQIALTRAVALPADSPPPPLNEEEIAFLKTFKAW